MGLRHPSHKGSDPGSLLSLLTLITSSNDDKVRIVGLCQITIKSEINMFSVPIEIALQLRGRYSCKCLTPIQKNGKHQLRFCFFDKDVNLCHE